MNIFNVAILTCDSRTDALGVFELVPDDKLLRDIKRGIVAYLLNLT